MIAWPPGNETAAMLTSPPPIVRVTVTPPSSGTNWVTLVIAILGVALSVAALGWQAYSFWRSGHRIIVDLRAGATDGGRLAQVEKSAFSVALGVLAGQGFRMAVLIATIRNTGRQGVTVQQCRWTIGDVTFSLPAVPSASSLFPQRLEAGEQCQAVIELELVLQVFQASVDLVNDHRRDVIAVAELGTGKPIRSKPLRVPPDIGALELCGYERDSGLNGLTLRTRCLRRRRA